MKKLFKFVLWLVVIILVLLVGAHFGLKAYLNSGSFRQLVQTQVEKNLHRKAELGAVNYALFPPAVRVQDVALKEKDATRNFVAFRELSLNYDVSKKEFTSILLKQPEFNITQFADGSYNFSDMLPAKPATEPAVKPAGPAAQPGAPAKPAAKPPVELKPATLPVSIALIQIEGAQFKFTKVTADGKARPFVLSGLNLDVRNITLDQAMVFQSAVQIGKSSTLDWKLDLGPLRTLPPDVANMPVSIQGRLALRSFEDVVAFVSPEQAESIPLTALELAWEGKGTLAQGFVFDLTATTPEVGGKNKLYANLKTQLRVMIPEAVINYLAYNRPLPETLIPPLPPSRLIPDEPALGANPAVALLLKTIQLQTSLKTDRLAYERNVVRDVDVQLALSDGKLNLTPLHCALFGGTVDGQASADLLRYPLSFAADGLVITNISLAQVLEANLDLARDSALSGLSGTLRAVFSARGRGISPPMLKTQLQADGSFNMFNSQKVNTGGSFLDQLILKLDNPILIQFIPQLRARVEEARFNAAQVSTTKLENVVAQFSLAQGTATLQQFRMGTPDYILSASGEVYPFDDKLDMKAQAHFSPAATAKLTDGKDMSDTLPYENGGLLIPLTIKGTLKRPVPFPDIELIAKNLARAQLKGGLGDKIKEAVGEDNEDVKKGLQILDNVLGGKKPQEEGTPVGQPEKQPEPALTPENLIKGLGGFLQKK